MFWSYLIFRILGIKDHAPDFRELFRFSIWLCTSKVTNEQPYKYSPVIRLCNMLSCNNIQITHMPNMLGITNIYTLCWLFMLQTYSHFPFCFSHHPQKKSLLHFIVILTPQPQPLAGTELVSVTTVVPFVKLSISGKKCYKYSQTSVCMNVCYYFSWVTSRSGCGC